MSFIRESKEYQSKEFVIELLRDAKNCVRNDTAEIWRSFASEETRGLPQALRA
jgi:hypothetical protein